MRVVTESHPQEGNECQQLGQLRPLGRAERREYPFFSGEVIGQNTVQERMSGIRELYEFSSAGIGAGFPGEEPRVFQPERRPPPLWKGRLKIRRR